MADEILDVIETFRGDDDNFEMNFVDEDGVAINITNYEIKFSVKKSGSDEVLIGKESLPNGSATEIEKTSPQNGKAILYINSDDTGGLDPGAYEYDVQYTENSNIHTYTRGVFVIKGDVTP